MAVIDFSNAVIERVGTWNINSGQNALLGINTGMFYAVGGTSTISENYNCAILANDTDKVKVLISGRIRSDASPGTAVTLFSNTTATWRISNISYAPGDTYAFTIEIDLSYL